MVIPTSKQSTCPRGCMRDAESRAGQPFRPRAFREGERRATGNPSRLATEGYIRGRAPRAPGLSSRPPRGYLQENTWNRLKSRCAGDGSKSCSSLVQDRPERDPEGTLTGCAKVIRLPGIPGVKRLEEVFDLHQENLVGHSDRSGKLPPPLLGASTGPVEQGWPCLAVLRAI